MPIRAFKLNFRMNDGSLESQFNISGQLAFLLSVYFYSINMAIHSGVQIFKLSNKCYLIATVWQYRYGISHMF